MFACFMFWRSIEAPSTLHGRNLKTDVSPWKRIKCFPSTLRRRNLKMWSILQHLAHWLVKHLLCLSVSIFPAPRHVHSYSVLWLANLPSCFMIGQRFILCSGTPPYGHLVNTVTSLLRPLFCPCETPIHFFHKKTPLMRPTAKFWNPHLYKPL